jgi:protein-S-isoprenylcysteine O-methyltransferase Ste14
MAVLIKPPLIALILIAFALILHFTFPIDKVFSFPSNLTGVLFIFLGILVAIWGRTTFVRLKTPLVPGTKPKKLVQEGPFTFCRNPMYLGMLLLLTGISVLLGSLSPLAAPIIFFIIMNFIFIPFEERLVEKTFGKRYLDYKKKVRRWI